MLFLYTVFDYRKTAAFVTVVSLRRVLVLITSRAENIFPINTALLLRALRKISRLYFNSLHKVIAELTEEEQRVFYQTIYDRLLELAN